MPDPVDKELQPSDTQAASLPPTNFEKSSDSDEDKIREFGEKDAERSEKIDEISEKDESRIADLEEIKTGATEASAITPTTSVTQAQQKKPWHKKLNPLRWGSPPPVPEKPVQSREHDAGFLSKLTFQWMGPLMHVSFSTFSNSISLVIFQICKPPISDMRRGPSYNAFADSMISIGWLPKTPGRE
jgi:hypothetical protein